MLFHATRVEPLSLSEIKRNFPEPEAGRAKSVMARFVEVELVTLNENGEYYSNFPENYINYSSYKYDNDLEAKKDSKVFRLMKQFTGIKEYWRDKTYFSIDAFFTDEQTQELIEMFSQIKVKAKEFANENAKRKSIGKLKFRRIKFYDMFFSAVLAFVCLFGIANEAKAFEAIELYDVVDYQSWISLNAEELFAAGGSGNDPTGNRIDPFDSIRINGDLVKRLQGQVVQIDRRALDGFSILSPNPYYLGSRPLSYGGGNDPGEISAPNCYIPSEQGLELPIRSVALCEAQSKVNLLDVCGDNASCIQIKRDLNDILF